ERSIAWLTRGNRKLRYRGVAKNDAWLHHRIAALNLRRLLVLGLTRQHGDWARPARLRGNMVGATRMVLAALVESQ
ncbi:MAG: hypothetical protein ACRD0W_19120, partial [Acidimicrobiales bacterium]